jgi:hypothetical protein
MSQIFLLADMLITPELTIENAAAARDTMPTSRVQTQSSSKESSLILRKLWLLGATRGSPLKPHDMQWNHRGKTVFL